MISYPGDQDTRWDLLLRPIATAMQDTMTTCTMLKHIRVHAAKMLGPGVGHGRLHCNARQWLAAGEGRGFWGWDREAKMWRRGEG